MSLTKLAGVHFVGCLQDAAQRRPVFGGTPGICRLMRWSVYSASKAAVRSFARTWSSDLRGRGIQVNAVSPGVIPTPAHGNAAASPDALNSFMEFAASITPLARTGTVEEVANVVAFLASDDSSFVAASEIFVDLNCLRIYNGPDGESHFGEVEIPLTPTEFFPGVLPLGVSERHRSTHVQFVTVPAEIREAGWHTPPEPLLVIWLNGETEFETSDGEIRRLGPGSAVLAEDTWGKGHISRHPAVEQQIIMISVPDGLVARTS